MNFTMHLFSLNAFSGACYLFLVIFICLLWISWTDLRWRIISNRMVGVIACFILPFAYLTHQQFFFLPAVMTLVMGFLLFLMNVVGAGDIKLLSVLMLAVPREQVLFLLFFMTLIGALLALVGWLFFRQTVKEQGLPYGVAIAGGFIIQQILFFPFVSVF